MPSGIIERIKNYNKLLNTVSNLNENKKKKKKEREKKKQTKKQKQASWTTAQIQTR